jgi:biopolymer transport protein ExbB
MAQVRIKAVWAAAAGVLVAGAAWAQGAATTPNTGQSLEDLFDRGGPLMWPILLCSVVMVAFIFERWIGLRHSRIFPAKLHERLLGLAREGRLDEAREVCRTGRSEFARLVGGGLARAEADGFEMEAGLEEEGGRVLYNLRNNCKPLSVMADVAPLLGLMGTVTGMIKAFDVVAKSNALGRTELLAEGISEALLTTAFGMAVAVPSVIAYHIFRSRADNLLREMEDAALEIVAAMRKGLKR